MKIISNEEESEGMGAASAQVPKQNTLDIFQEGLEILSRVEQAEQHDCINQGDVLGQSRVFGFYPE